jgi:hypothetical protein
MGIQMNERDKELAKQAWTENDWDGHVDIPKLIQLVRADAMETANRAATASWTLMCKKMVEFEREACAKLCDEAIRKEQKLLSSAENNLGNFFVQHRITAHMNDAREIRARGQT